MSESSKQPSFDLIVGPRRCRHVALARHACMYLTRRLTNLSFTSIGDKLGCRYHATAMRGVSKIERLIAIDPPH